MPPPALTATIGLMHITLALEVKAPARCAACLANAVATVGVGTAERRCDVSRRWSADAKHDWYGRTC